MKEGKLFVSDELAADDKLTERPRETRQSSPLYGYKEQLNSFLRTGTINYRFLYGEMLSPG